MSVHAGERRCGLWVITKVRIVKGFQEEELGEGQQCHCREVMRRRTEKNALDLPIRWPQ